MLSHTHDHTLVDIQKKSLTSPGVYKRTANNVDLDISSLQKESQISSLHSTIKQLN